MADPAKEITRPAVFRKRVKVLQVVENGKEGVFVRDDVLDEQDTFEPWQYFVLEVLIGCEDFAKLASVFKDRFNRDLTEREIDDLFALVEKHKWFSLAGTDHPLVIASRKRYEALPKDPSGKPLSYGPAGNGKPPETKKEEEKKPLPPGVHDALGLDDATHKRIWKLFDPRPLLKLTHPFLWPLRHTVYVLPLLLVAGLGIVIKYAGPLGDDFNVRHRDVPLVWHLLISMVTDNLLAMWATGLAAYHFRATVDAFGIVVHYYVLPRFIVRVGNTKQLTRREVIWLHAAPMLTRLTLFNVGILLWYAFRATHETLSSLGLTLATASTISLAITANPLLKSNMYYLLCAFLNEDGLRGKSTRALIDKVRGTSYQKYDSKVLTAYALASAVFLSIAFVLILYLVDAYLEWYLGGPGLVLLVIIATIMVVVLITKFTSLNQSFKRTTQFEQWRDRVMPEKTTPDGLKQPNRLARWAFGATGLILVAAMFLPYTYEVGGSFVVLPEQTQNVTSPIAGTVEEIHYDGGEALEAGTVVGRLSFADDEVQVKSLDAKIAEQEAVIAELRSRPLPEEVRLAELNVATDETRAKLSKAKLDRMEELYAATSADVVLAQRRLALAELSLKTAETHALFSKDKLDRTEGLYNTNAVSLEDLESARREYEIDVDQIEEARGNVEVLRADVKKEEDDSFDELDDMRYQHEVDLQQVEESRANLELVKVGAKPEEIQAAEEKLQGWKDERDYYLDRIEKSTYRMPFKGTLVATRLKEKIGSYIDKGDVLAVAESTAQMIVQIDLPETDVGAVKPGAEVTARLPAFVDEDFDGHVTVIESTVTEVELSPVIRVTALIPNPDGRLRTGMSGYAKITSEKMPVWKVLSLGIVRFFKVEVWSWLP